MEFKETDRPFHVRTSTTKEFVSGHDTQEAADVAVARCNKDAEILDLEARYIVVPKEGS